MPATIGACEANQAAWNAAVARAVGGETWEDSGLRWSWQPHNGHLMLSFPAAIGAPAARRGVAAARDRGAVIVGAWLSPSVDATALVAAGFRRGWEPWWMATELDAVMAPGDPRVELSAHVPEYDADGRRLLALAAGEAAAWHAVTRVDGRLAGRAWAFAAEGVAGVYDMEVGTEFRRRGLGRALLRAVCHGAREAGAHTAILNATPEGAALYAAEGFRRLGTGVTYWHHLGCEAQVSPSQTPRRL